MNNLVKVNFEGERQTLSARELWESLDKPYNRFDRWFSQYKDYGFTEDEDYRAYVQKSTHANGRDYDATDYEITIEMAKELAMLQRSEKGKQIRQYLIQLEKAWNTPEAVMARALKMADQKILEYKNNVIQLEAKIQQDRPKVIFAEALEVSESSILVGDLAKILRQNGIDIGQNRLFEFLRKEEFLISRKGESYNMPTQKSMDMKLFEIKVRTVNNPDGTVRQTKTPKVTGKGQIYFINLLKKQEAI